MANNSWRHALHTQVKQVWSGTVTTTTLNHTYIVTLTLDDGSTQAVTFTVTAAETTVTLVAVAFVSAWNLSQLRGVKHITASNVAGAITLTADKAGQPFSAAASGTGTWSGDGNTVECVSRHDYAQAGNWQLDAVPVITNDVIFNQGVQSIFYGLDQSGVALADFRVLPGCSSEFGLIEDGLGQYLQIDPNLFRYEGNGRKCLFDLSAAAIAVHIDGQGQPTATGLHAIYLIGSALTTVDILRGNVGLAVFDADTATITTLRVGHVQNPFADSDVTVGSGVTLTTLDANAGQTLMKGGCTTANVAADAVVTTEGAGTITTANVYGKAYLNSTGTVTTLNCWGTVDLSQDRQSKTITTVNGKAGGELILHAGITVTTLNHPTEPGTFTVRYVD